MSRGAKRKARKKQTVLRHAVEAERQKELQAHTASAELRDAQDDVVLMQTTSLCCKDSPCSVLAGAPSFCESAVSFDESDALPKCSAGDHETASGASDAEPVLSGHQSNRGSLRDPFVGAMSSSNSSPRASPAAAPLLVDSGVALDNPADQGRSRASSSEAFDAEPVLSASQSLRHSAREARVGAAVTPNLLAAQALRACAREAWVSAEIRMRSGVRGRSRAPWLHADGSSGENWVDGFSVVVKNTFLDIEEIMEPQPCAVRARSCPAHGGA